MKELHPIDAESVGILLPEMLGSNVRISICDRPRQNQPYCAGHQSEIRVKIVAQGEY